MAQWADPVRKGVSFPPPHLGLVWRRARVSDLERMLILAAQATTGENHFRREPVMLARLARMNVLPEFSDVIGGFDAEGVMQAYASVIVNPLNTPIVRAQVEGVISRSWRQKGIGRAVLEWQDGRARELAMRVPGATGIEIDSVSEEENADLRRLLAAGGFAPVESRRFYLADVAQMAVQGRESLAYLHGHGYHVHALREEDLDELHLMNNSDCAKSPFLKPAGDEDWRLLIGTVNAEASIVVDDVDGIAMYGLVEEGRQGSGLVRARGVRPHVSTDVMRHVILAHASFVAARFSQLRVLVADNEPIVDALKLAGFTPDGVLIRYAITL
ncbi:hypothetical protein ACFPGO_01020 [Arcanobacterium canis]|uniref:N-acetyltransferase domain-containing protein n=1 Tax=Arcanobacterium canis TaxID=999183 RepID=A0ABY8FWT6_9ACTO|nr:hypothetical protein [Arcanobacterium canis]WFM82712.1 hypothetical protein P7079_04705 [Arcanobacterium canis]